ncbi:hypothetical protein GNF10_13585 [Nostoc sp. UCD121]|uniref:hypothetical protein n=1 Tax=unclassified Nostoc TaxID=2593658 RepID=UPI001626174C|nr:MULTISPECIES: hypothetical protein [unclassified Nostoc]MBC1224109.1 hypothetical protein [Nostoc sp. UCD120]MBC1276972.1 hypothetical protein [Nostoc sp. UCD121]MBC1293955.1 hypothetical protein [Nostoc sp. UCD122]
MSENTKFHNPEWLSDLSEEEQENLAAGQIANIPGGSNFFIQQTNIKSAADNTLNLVSGDVSSQKTRYSLSQFTIGSSITFGLPNFSLGGDKLKNLIANLLNSVFS